MRYSYVANGDANSYTILDGTDKWLAQVRVNGELTLAQQTILMQDMVDDLNQNEESEA